MAFFNVRSAEVQPDRRVSRRFVIDCPARLVLSGGMRDGRISDLSEQGARFEGRDLPAAGLKGFLAWLGEEHYCTVIWSDKERCGVKFDRAIRTGLVEASANSVDVVVKPVAAVGKIPLGQRRSRGFVSTD